VEEVAKGLGRSKGAVHMLRARAYDRLKELLGSTSLFFSDSP
jgi:DNA-directed RNA polymerase specialized sigma24 family protein